MNNSSAAESELPKKRAKVLTEETILLHQNRELVFALKLAKEEIVSLKSSQLRHQQEMNKEASKFSMLHRAWKHVNTELSLVADKLGISLLSCNLRNSALSRFVLASPYGDDDNEKEDVVLNQDDLNHGLQWTRDICQALLLQNQSEEVTCESVIAHPSLLASRIELLEEKLHIALEQIDELKDQVEEEKNVSWRLSRRLDSCLSHPPLESTPPLHAQSSSPPVVSSITLDGGGVVEQEWLRSLAQSRLEEIQRLREENLLLYREKEASLLHVLEEKLLKNSDLENLDPILVDQLKDVRCAQVGRVSELCVEKLARCEHTLTQVVLLGDVHSKSMETSLRKEVSTLVEEVDRLRTRLESQNIQLDSLHTIKSMLEDTQDMLVQVRKEYALLEKRIQRNEGEDSELIAELEMLSDSLTYARNSSSKWQHDVSRLEADLSKLYRIKFELEQELRESLEEKAMLRVRAEKISLLMEENNVTMDSLRDMLNRQQELQTQSDQLVCASTEACERAVAREEALKRIVARCVLTQEEELTDKCQLARLQHQVSLLQGEKARLEEQVKLQHHGQRRTDVVDTLPTSSSSLSALEVRFNAMSRALHCPVNRNMWIDCVITKCAHLFSRQALEDNLANRNRKCPTCKNQYSKDDLLTIYLYQSN